MGWKGWISKIGYAPWKLYSMVPESMLSEVPVIFLALLPEEQDDVTVSQVPVQVMFVLDTSTTI